MKKYDAIIIGFGKGGKTLASWLASQGKKVAVIEKDKNMYGGTCINIGCIPTKILVEESEKKEKTYKESIQWKRELTSKLRGANYNKLDAFESLDVYDGLGSFVDKNTIEIQTENSVERIQGGNIFINTGAKEFIPSINGIENTKNVYTSTTIMELEELPKKLVIIGGGYIGLEFASIYSNFGSQVTILEAGEDILLKEEKEISEEIKSNFKVRNINVLSKVKVDKLSNANNDVEILINQNGNSETLVADVVLIASGRRPLVSGLKLENANVEYDERGIKVNQFLQTSTPNIYALGDVKGGLQFTYISLDDFRIVKNHLLGNESLTTESRNVIPYSLFISPTLSIVGLTEKEAIAKGYEVKTKLLKVAQVPRAKILRNETGLFKVVVDKNTQMILGCSLYGIESSEIINIVAMAMKENKPFSYLRDFIFTHPTMAESLNDLFDL